ncbi:target of rapamycin complex 2 subunit MAPKAP1 [Cimex lectularius]|uniref:Target of rapamycin complex 2 subunit MAPKAP1 n=1 Tax=Cimex lectularius TaxID=79782 RepID=A0A8I6RUD7_CIMLE|nr:target of rapamycin complex 2 subunit MAPKAP1 [Cimex lectularius]
MALYDNKHWLLSHIRNSFIAADDSGMCEVVMICDNIAKQTQLSKYSCYPGVEEDEDDDGQSFDLNSDLQFGLRRHRLNTAQRLEKLEEEKKKAANIMHVKWEANPNPLSAEERAELFPKKDMTKVREEIKKVKKISVITEMLSKFPNMPLNPFKNYAKMDGNAQVGSPTKKYLIFITMLNEDKRKYPMEVVVIASAKVMDLIGLICWKCSLEHPEINLRDSASHYGLYIAEDDGDVDWDFPCLDSREVVGKFGFTYLALVERDTVTHNHEESYPFIIESTLHHVPAEATSSRAQQEDTRSSAPVSQTFNICALNRVRTKTDIYLEISSDKLEVTPVIQPYLSSGRKVSTKLWGKQRAKSHHMDDVVACDLTEHKSNSRSTFRIVYYYHKKDTRTEEPTGKFKPKDYESETRIAVEIVKKVNEILDFRQSLRRKEYIALRERKSHRRKNFLGPR